jgi:hypothetical protein
VIMHSLSRPISHLTLALAGAVALLSTSLAQEVASVDLTKVEARIDLRRPKASSPITGPSGGETYNDCPEEFPHRHQLHASTQKESAHGVALRASLVSLDRTHYPWGRLIQTGKMSLRAIGETSKLEVTVENTGSELIRIPFSPHLADLQPRDPAQKFSYLKLEIDLWIAGEYWSAATGRAAALYGADDHPGSMLSLHPGQRARIIGEGLFTLPNHLPQPAGRVYAEASLYREETLVAPTRSWTVEHVICFTHTPGQSVSIQLTVP